MTTEAGVIREVRSMKQYFLSIMEGAWYLPGCTGSVCVGGHSSIHDFINEINPFLTEHVEYALESLFEEQTAFIDMGKYQIFLTRTS